MSKQNGSQYENKKDFLATLKNRAPKTLAVAGGVAGGWAIMRLINSKMVAQGFGFLGEAVNNTVKNPMGKYLPGVGLFVGGIIAMGNTKNEMLQDACLGVSIAGALDVAEKTFGTLRGFAGFAGLGAADDEEFGEIGAYDDEFGNIGEIGYTDEEIGAIRSIRAKRRLAKSAVKNSGAAKMQKPAIKSAVKPAITPAITPTNFVAQSSSNFDFNMFNRLAGADEEEMGYTEEYRTEFGETAGIEGVGGLGNANNNIADLA